MILEKTAEPGLSEDELSTAPYRGSTSSYLWDIQWQDHFSVPINGVTVRHCSYAQSRAFIQTEFPRIYETDRSAPKFLGFDSSPAKDRFYRCADWFLFLDGEQTVGAYGGHPSDWSTYYIRTMGLLPAHQGKGIFSSFLSQKLDILKAHGVERAYGEVRSTHHAQIHLFNRMGFTVTGTDNSERWGAVLTFTKFLSRRHKTVFDRQFISMPE